MSWFEEYPLWDDIHDIIKAENQGTYHYDLTLHSHSDELKAIDIISIDIESDYVNGYTDIITVVAIFPIGDFVYRMYPYRDMLEASLDIKGIETRYRVILPNNVLKIASDMYETFNDMETLNEFTTHTIEMQLVELAAEPAKMATSEDVFRGKLIDIIPNVFKAALSTIRVNGKKIITKVIMQDPDNDKEYDPFVIESHTSMMGLVSWIQSSYGIYYHGASRYVSFKGNKVYWRIYDICNPLKYENEKHKIRCFLIPPNHKLPMMNSWKEEEDVLSFIGTTPMQDSTGLDSRPTNRPIGSSFQTADKLTLNDIKIDGGYPYGSDDWVSKQVIYTKRPDLLVDKPHDGLTNNKFDAISKQVGNFLGTKTVIWHAAKINHILPGNTLNLYTVDKMDKIVEFKCAILRTKRIINKESAAVSVDEMKKMTCTMVLTLGIMNRL